MSKIRGSESERLRWTVKNRAPLDAGSGKAVRSREPLERIQIENSPRKGHGLEEDLFSGSRWPPLEYLLSLLSFCNQLGKRVQRSVKTQKTFQHGGKKKNAAADIFLFIELNGNFQPSAKTIPRHGAWTSDDLLAGHRSNAGDLLPYHCGIGDIIKSQYLLERLAPALEQ